MGKARLLSGLMALVLTVFVVGCETAPKPTPGSGSSGNYKVGTPYKVGGVWYYPKEQPDYDETGLASWYGDDFHGKSTANGETYNQFDMTAAHKTLPMPVMVRVTNLENGRQIDVRVNDRGPFVKGRIIDLSSKAADLLDIKRKGTAMVRVQYLGRLDNETFYAAKPETPASQKQVKAAPVKTVASDDLGPLPGATEAAPLNVPITSETSKSEATLVRTVPVENSPHMFVQAAAFLYRQNAVNLQNTLVAEGHDRGSVMIDAATVDGNEFYRVRIGPLKTVEYADLTLDRVLDAGHRGARIVVD